MHPQAHDWVRDNLPTDYTVVVECGSQNLNGSVRDLVPNTTFTGVDVAAGEGVDVVCDFADYNHPEPADLVISTEVFEHVEHWRKLIEAAARNLREGGTFICTAAAPGRAPHSGIVAEGLQPGEFYRNIDPRDLDAELGLWFSDWQIDVLGTDIRAVAVK